MSNPVHIVATPVGVQFTKPSHDPLEDSVLNGSYDTLTQIIAGAPAIDNSDAPHLTLNDWVYAARMAQGDL